MKRKFNYLAFSICFAISIAGISTKTYSQRLKFNINDSLKNSRLYHAQTAYDDVRRFDSISSSIYYRMDIDNITTVYRRVEPITAFTISKMDLLYALGMSPEKVKHILNENDKYNNIRAYLGIDTPGYKFKLFLVPVTGYQNDTANAGEDMVLDSLGNIFPPNCSPDTSKKRDCLKDMRVLDLNSPCPNYCYFSSIFLPTQPKSTSSKPTIMKVKNKNK